MSFPTAACRLLPALLMLALSPAAFGQPPGAPAPVHTPYAQRGPLALRRVTLSAPSVPRYGRLEIRVDLRATYDNPFDPAEVALDARVTPPSGKAITVPGFLYRAYTRKLVSGMEELTPAGPPSWLIRYSP